MRRLEFHMSKVRADVVWWRESICRGRSDVICWQFLYPFVSYISVLLFESIVFISVSDKHPDSGVDKSALAWQVHRGVQLKMRQKRSQTMLVFIRFVWADCQTVQKKCCILVWVTKESSENCHHALFFRKAEWRQSCSSSFKGVGP